MHHAADKLSVQTAYGIEYEIYLTFMVLGWISLIRVHAIAASDLGISWVRFSPKPADSAAWRVNAFATSLITCNSRSAIASSTRGDGCDG